MIGGRVSGVGSAFLLVRESSIREIVSWEEGLFGEVVSFFFLCLDYFIVSLFINLSYLFKFNSSFSFHVFKSLTNFIQIQKNQSKFK